jgi:hypothetical protein
LKPSLFWVWLRLWQAYIHHVLCAYAPENSLVEVDDFPGLKRMVDWRQHAAKLQHDVGDLEQAASCSGETVYMYRFECSKSLSQSSSHSLTDQDCVPQQLLSATVSFSPK